METIRDIDFLPMGETRAQCVCLVRQTAKRGALDDLGRVALLPGLADLDAGFLHLALQTFSGPPQEPISIGEAQVVYPGSLFSVQ